MTADSGYIQCTFSGNPDVLASFLAIAAETDRENLFSCGLSWLDDLNCDGEVESDVVSYDTISATREFLSSLLIRLPDLEIEGRLEHSWPVLPPRKTVVEFSSNGGTLIWNEAEAEEELELFPYFGDEEEEDIDPEEIEIPLTPYD